MEKENKRGSLPLWQRLSSVLRKRSVTQEDLENIIDSVQETGILDEEENEMIHRIFELKDIVVREVMVPRTDIKALELDSSMEDVANMVVDAGHSRLPVYDESIDRIVGVIYAKDLLRFWLHKGKDVKIKDLMRKPFFVPETKSIADLLKEMKTKRTHIAAVVDEYGGTSGIVTIEDLLEEIVGDIQDEYDLEEEEFVEAEEGGYIVDAKMDIEELAERLDVEISKNDYDTLGGFVVHLFDRIPAVDEEIRFEDLLFTVVESDERRICKVKVEVIHKAAEDEKKEKPSEA